MRDSKTMSWTEKTAIMEDEKQSLTTVIEAKRKIIDRK